MASDERTSTGSGHPAADVLVPHERYYYEDGNILLLVSNTKFKVYRGPLAQQSTILADMLAIPTPVNQEMMDGVPVVRLHDDLGNFQNTMEVVFDSPDDYEYVGGCLARILRLATKYDMQRTIKWAKAQLERQFPHSGFADWEEKRGAFEGVVELVAGCCVVGLMNILVPAFYHLVTYDWDDHFDDKPEAELSLLSTEDRDRMAVARLRLLSEASTIVQDLPEYGFCQAKKCSRDCDHSPKSAWLTPPTALAEFLRDPLGTLVSWSPAKLCSTCLKKSKERRRKAAKALYERLPKVLQLEGADDSSSSSDAAMI